MGPREGPVSGTFGHSYSFGLCYVYIKAGGGGTLSNLTGLLSKHDSLLQNPNLQPKTIINIYRHKEIIAMRNKYIFSKFLFL